MWQAAERERVRRLAELQAAEVRRGAEADWATGASYGGTRYEWRLQEEIVGSAGVTSGAAAVLVKRRRAGSGCERDKQSPPRLQGTGSDGNPETSSKGDGRRNKRHEEGGDDFVEAGRKRLRDAFGDG